MNETWVIGRFQPINYNARFFFYKLLSQWEMVFNHAHGGHHNYFKFVLAYTLKHSVDSTYQMVLKSINCQVEVEHIEQRK